MNGQINLKEKTVTELKALAYDVQGYVTQYSSILSVVKQEIEAREVEAANKIKAEQEPEPEQKG